MKIGIPLKNDMISKIYDATQFGVVDLEEGQIKNIEYFTSLDDLMGKIEFFVTNNSNEEIDEMYDYSIEVLKTPVEEMSVDEIIEAFLFRELYDYNL